ncbi:MAG: hypothetical protein ACTHMA_18135 [Thermomicrobiales bacterium]
MLFPLNPFPDAPISDGYTPPQSVHVILADASANYRYANMDGQRYIKDYTAERENNLPQHSPFDNIFAAPFMLPSGSR